MKIDSQAGQMLNNETRIPSSNENQKLGLSHSIDLIQRPKYELSISEAAVVKAIEKVNKALMGVPKSVEYSIHKPHGDIVIKIVNADTKEVIKEIPPEKILDMIDKLQEISSGAIIDEKR